MSLVVRCRVAGADWRICGHRHPFRPSALFSPSPLLIVIVTLSPAWPFVPPACCCLCGLLSSRLRVCRVWTPRLSKGAVRSNIFAASELPSIHYGVAHDGCLLYSSSVVHCCSSALPLLVAFGASAWHECEVGDRALDAITLALLRHTCDDSCPPSVYEFAVCRGNDIIDHVPRKL
ncbi:uncharacterized protein LAESUDRAFT_7774 [Laetiporus sulphureus 93-53]|uniref:Uncharacterized protein n=1 Tax=Laetiporus sulphureus 93-53 TaxID=1314785 RepID=A0A165I512_9APHY|nr:uncharacterized protein LAESUDRAFT_7774 [Laetiporus sulphureus 93-53]KZT12601.1 hypothetical protein LAESUDRAFT_7774 [Laetiporus sulphureus 93-53]